MPEHPASRIAGNFVAPVVILTLTVLLVLMGTSGCSRDADSTTKVGTVLNPIRLTTVKHDGHLWIVATTGSYEGGVSIIHHPDCTAFHNNQ